MPLFEFECENCHHRFEELQSASDTTLPECPACNQATVKKLVSAGAIHGGGLASGSSDFSAPSCSPGGG